VKAQRIARMLRTGEVYSGRSVPLLPMSLETCRAIVAPRDLYRKVWALKDVEWRDGAMVLLVKVFPEQPGQDYATARDLAAHLRAIRRAGVSLRGLRVKGYRGRESKGELARAAMRARRVRVPPIQPGIFIPPFRST
jgi:hypothetical protein